MDQTPFRAFVKLEVPGEHPGGQNEVAGYRALECEGDGKVKVSICVV